MLAIAAWATTHGQILSAASSSEDDGGNIGLIFLLSGFVFYGVIYFKYRNVDKRHKHEVETEATLHNMQGYDQFVESRKGLSQPRLAGANNKDVRGAQRKFF